MYEVLGALAYKAHPYHWPIIGWMSDIEAITREAGGALQDLLRSEQCHGNHRRGCRRQPDHGGSAPPFRIRSRGRRRRLFVPLSPRSWVSTAPRSAADGSRRLGHGLSYPGL